MAAGIEQALRRGLTDRPDHDPAWDALVYPFVAAMSDAYPQLMPPLSGAVDQLRTVVACADSPTEILDPQRGPDLFLAAQCMAGSGPAVGELELQYGGHLDEAVARVRGPRVSTEDLAAVVRHRLIVGTETRAPLLSQYGGKGPLGAWLRVTASRLAISLARGKTVRGSDGHVQADVESLEAMADGELDFLKRLYRDAFRECLADAAATLSKRERTLLRYTYVESLSARRLAKIYGVHHATMARHVDQARQSLVQATREAIGNRLGVSRTELESIARLAASRLDITLQRILADD